MLHLPDCIVFPLLFGPHPGAVFEANACFGSIPVASGEFTAKGRKIYTNASPVLFADKQISRQFQGIVAAAANRRAFRQDADWPGFERFKEIVLLIAGLLLFHNRVFAPRQTPIHSIAIGVAILVVRSAQKDFQGIDLDLEGRNVNPGMRNGWNNHRGCKQEAKCGSAVKSVAIVVIFEFSPFRCQSRNGLVSEEHDCDTKKDHG